MAAENFKITPRTVYTIQSRHGAIECDGIDGLQAHIDNTIGALVDCMMAGYTGLLQRDKIKAFEYIKANIPAFQTALALADAVEDMRREIEDQE